MGLSEAGISPLLPFDPHQSWFGPFMAGNGPHRCLAGHIHIGLCPDCSDAVGLLELSRADSTRSHQSPSSPP